MADLKQTIESIIDAKTTWLEKESRSFFGCYGTRKLLGNRFFDQINEDDPDRIFDAMVNACGFCDPSAFFHAIAGQIKKQQPICLNSIQIPVLYVYILLETIYPGQQVHTIKTVDQLRAVTGFKFERNNRLQTVLDRFPVKLSDHLIRQSLVSEAVFNQYMPDIRELDHLGHDITFDGHFKNGLLEQMYQNRVVFLLDMNCPAFCRFCFRKHKSNRKEKTPSIDDVKAAVDHVKHHPTVKEILITGGEPLLNRPNLDRAIEGLVKIDHVKTIRIATRSIAYFPHLFLQDDRALIKDLTAKQKMAGSNGKRIEIGIHLVHPDEISIDSLAIIADLVRQGIRVYLQTPFLNRINTDGTTLARLFTLLRQVGVQIYYIFAPCSPIHGTKTFWAPISLAMDAETDLHKSVSDRSIPKLCTATPLGKIEWHTSGWAVERDETDPSFTWIRTPYTLDYFNQFLDHTTNSLDSYDGMMPEFRVNPEGTLDARFRLTMGKERLYLGRPDMADKTRKATSPPLDKTKDAVYRILQNTPLYRPSDRPVPSKNLSRFHDACVEVNINAIKADSAFVELSYIRDHPQITDVVIQASVKDLMEIKVLVNALKQIPHVTFARLCFPAFLIHGEAISSDEIRIISSLMDHSIADPFRIEIETWAVTPGFDPGIAKTVTAFLDMGVNTYANVPLISGVNDDPQTLVKLAHELRDHHIEFHQLYISGLTIQTDLTEQYGLQPVDQQTLVDIFSAIRTDCSGREIPTYRFVNNKGEQPFRLWEF